MLRGQPILSAKAGILASFLLLVGPQVAAETLVVGGEDGYAPYETLDANGRPIGFNVDLMRAVARASDRDVQFRLGSWEAAREDLQAGEIDVLGMFVSERRARSVDFARPHLIVNHRIFIPAGAPTISSIEDLAGRSVIVQEAAWSHEYLSQSGPTMDLTLVDSDSAGLRLLAQGGHDAALLTEHRGRHTLQQQNLDELTVSGPPVLPVEYALAVREGNEALLETINRGLEQVMASGEFDRIYDRWLQPLDEPHRRTGPVPQTTVIVAATVLLLAFAWLVRKLLTYRRDMRAAHDELAYLREHDSLTGLLSRHALEQALVRLCRSTDERWHSLLHINVDQFRVINDALGHRDADDMLKALARRLEETLPSGTRVARLGADEFAVLLEDTPGETARALGEALLESLDKDPIRPAQELQPLTIGIGVVAFDREEGDIARILRRADCACLAAKEDGGNQVHAWHPDDARLAEKYGELGWVARIQSALGEDRMVVYWQPIAPVDGPPDRIIAVEILVRMLPPDDKGDVIPAGRFMPAAERYFITAQIDRWVLAHMFDWMDTHADTIASLERVNLNISGRSLGDSRFLSFLERRIQRYAHLLPRLCLEVTETALISNLEQARQILERLHRGGCRIALDDFGTGVSSMNYLRQLPVDYLKIDGSFVQDIDHDSEAFDFINELNRLGHAMGKITVAECVESESVRLYLKKAGIDLVQGHLIGHPQPLSSLQDHLASLATVSTAP